MDRTEEEQRALELLIPRKVFRMYKKPHPRYVVCHIRAVVDEDYLVYRVWRPGRGWVYRMDSLYYFGLLIQDGKLEMIGDDK